jgi:nucleotide-binding universal stress UspA family protein
VDIETVLRQGAPHTTILEYADEADVDLIVMGTHGRSGIHRYLLGSVTERVVRTADAPVLTVRMEREE